MARNKASQGAQIPNKPYKAAVEELVKSTEVRVTDLDAKVYKFLDYLQQQERAIDGVRHIKTSVESLERQRIFDWRKYLYTLLRKFDEAAYQAMKNGEEGRKPPRTPGGRNGASPKAAQDMNSAAPEFVPGNLWTGRLVGTTPTADHILPSFFPFGMPPIDPALAMDPAILASPPPKSPKGGLDTGSSQKLPPNPAGGESPSLVKLLCLDDSSDVKLLASTPPPLPGDPLPSPGSAGHGTGTCKPCAFLHTKGCANGTNCEFCHLCDPEEKKRRKREKRHGHG